MTGVASGVTSAEAGQCGDVEAEPVGWRIRRLLEVQGLAPRIITLVDDKYGLGTLSEAWAEFRCGDTEADRGTLLEFTAESPFIEQFTSWLAYTWTPMMPSGKSEDAAVPARTFLAGHPDLDPLLARYLSACIETPFSFFEILSTEPGQRFTCCDLLCGGEPLVLESTAQDLHENQILYARIVAMDSVPLMDAAAPWPLPADDLKPAILALRKATQPPGGLEQADARHPLLAHDAEARSFYWGFIEQALSGKSVRLQGYCGGIGQR